MWTILAHRVRRTLKRLYWADNKVTKFLERLTRAVFRILRRLNT